MAQHPEMYTSDELSRFAAPAAAIPAEQASPSPNPAPVYSSSDITALPTRSEKLSLDELEGKEKEIEKSWSGVSYQRHVVNSQQRLQRSMSNPSTRPPVASIYETEFEDDIGDEKARSDGSDVHYVAQEAQVSRGRSVVQVRGTSKPSVTTSLQWQIEGQRGLCTGVSKPQRSQSDEFVLLGQLPPLYADHERSLESNKRSPLESAIEMALPDKE